jgi:hypothetical protein
LSVDGIPLQSQGSTFPGSQSIPAWSSPAGSGSRGWCGRRRRPLRRHRATRRCEAPQRPRALGRLGILPRPCGIFRRLSGAERVCSRPLIGALRHGLGQPLVRDRVRSATARADGLAERSITGKPVIGRNRTGTTPLPDGGERVSRLRCSGEVSGSGAANRGTHFNGPHRKVPLARYTNCQRRASLILCPKLLRCAGPTHRGSQFRGSMLPIGLSPSTDHRVHGLAVVG